VIGRAAHRPRRGISPRRFILAQALAINGKFCPGAVAKE
jgi:hypothetical protein